MERKAALRAYRLRFDQGNPVLFANQHVAYLGHLGGAPELAEDLAIMVEKCRLAGEVTGQRAFAGNVLNYIVRPKRRGPSESFRS